MPLSLAKVYNYLLFHSFVEIFSIIVAFCVFIITWHSRKNLNNNFVLLIGLAYLFVGGLDLIHTLSYKGMGVFPGYDSNLPTQLWISSRIIESVSILLALLFLGRKMLVSIVMLSYTFIFILLINLIFNFNYFPTCFIEGVGLTPFKIISEYVIVAILLLSLFLIWKRKEHFDPKVYHLLAASIIVTIISEITFTFFNDLFAFMNLLGHLFKVISFYLIYQAIVVTGLVQPYNLLLLSLKKSQEELEEYKDQLEETVIIRTQDLQESEERFRKIISRAADSMFLCNMEGQILEVNKQAELSVGYSSEELLKMHVQDLDAIYQTPETIAETWQSLTLNNQKTLSSFHKRKDGSQFPVEIRVSMIELNNSKHILGFARDDSEAYGYRQKIDNLNQTLEAAQNMAKLGYWRVDKNNNISEWSHQMYEIFRFDSEQSVPEFSELINAINPIDRDVFMKATKNCWLGVAYQIVTHVNSKQDEEYRIISTQGFPILDSSGNVIEIFGTSQDITKLRLIEEELHRYQNELEDLVNKRTLELENKNLELEKFNKLFVGREFRIKELREKVRLLETNS